MRRLPLLTALLLCLPAGLPGETTPRRQGSEITDADRAWWCFQPVKPVTPPPVKAGWTQRNEIDAFILEKLEQAGLEPSPEAEKEALLRRVCFDLTGLPPTPAQREGFLGDSSPGAYEALVDSLLASPRHGEHWARLWLDLARYADSDGYKQDAFRPAAWRYRDWVIGSLNSDLPYDEFIRLQLAGDELAPEQPDARVATGFLRQGVYEYNNRDVKTQWGNILNEVTDTTSDAVLGLGMQCARCHNHKFDPILQEDYFKLQACFAGMRWRDDVPAATTAERQAWQEKMNAWLAANQPLLDELAAFEAPFRQKAEKDAVEKFPPEIEAVWNKGEANWSPGEVLWMDLVKRQLADGEASFEGKMKPEEKTRWREMKDRITAASATKPAPLPPAATITDVGPEAMPVDIPGRADKKNVAPGFLTVLGGGAAPLKGDGTSTGRRSALARWLTSPDHPLTARVLVNRLWQQHFGHGLAGNPNDLGQLGERPTHPALIDWLAGKFMAGGWHMKPVHRLIVLSATYRQSALTQPSQAAKLADPLDRLLWKMPVRRLASGQIRDASLAASGELDLNAGGPSVAGDAPRRTIYNKVLRNHPDPLLQSFDEPDAFRPVGTRQVTTTATQSLLMINGQWMQKRALAMAREIFPRARDLKGQLIREARLRATGREPSPEEVADGIDFLNAQQALAHASAKPVVPESAFVESRDLPAHGTCFAVTADLAKKRLFPEMKSAPAMPDGFTIESVVWLKSRGPERSLRTIASRWNGDQKQPGWALGVAGEKSAFTPGAALLQLCGTGENGQPFYLAVDSKLQVPLERPYFIAISFQPGQVHFTLKDMADDDAKPVETTISVPISTVPVAAEQPVTLGSRGDDQRSNVWDGLIGEVRLTARSLAPDQLLCVNPLQPEGVIGYWRFDGSAGPLADASPSGRNLEMPPPPDTRDDEITALADYCHVLLNSSEFLYVD